MSISSIQKSVNDFVDIHNLVIDLIEFFESITPSFNIIDNDIMTGCEFSDGLNISF